jgi:hypothetical protein
MKTLRNIWRRIASALQWKTRDTAGIDAALEREREKAAWLGAEIARQRTEIVQVRAEYARVREENRALLNSILGIAGIPPIPVALQDVRPLETLRANSAIPPRSHPSVQSGPDTPAPTMPADEIHPQVPTAVSGPVSPSILSSDVDTQTDLGCGSPQLAQASPESCGKEPTRTNAPIARGKSLQQVTAPMRRRSWQQINRTLEFEAARKHAGRDADALDA